MELWLCGQYRTGNIPGKIVWDFQGIFSTKEKAVGACLNKNYFIVSVDLDERIVDDPKLWPGIEYPLA